MMKKILVIGSSNTDMTVKSPSLPKPGETVIGGDFKMGPGGKGANGDITPSDIESNADLIRRSDILLLQLEMPVESVLAAASIAHEAGVFLNNFLFNTLLMKKSFVGVSVS